METQPKTPKRGPSLLLWVLLGILGGVIAATVWVESRTKVTWHPPGARSALLASQIAVAFRDYMLQYRQWPTNTADAMEADANLVSTLRGHNPKHTVFMEISPKLIDAQGRLVDQWNRPYWILFDQDCDNMITDPFNPTNTVNAAILVWSTGGKHPDVKNW